MLHEPVTVTPNPIPVSGVWWCSHRRHLVLCSSSLAVPATARLTCPLCCSGASSRPMSQAGVCCLVFHHHCWWCYSTALGSSSSADSSSPQRATVSGGSGAALAPHPCGRDALAAVWRLQLQHDRWCCIASRPGLGPKRPGLSRAEPG